LGVRGLQQINNLPTSPTFSVIIPFRNRAIESIKRNAESWSKQTDIDFELIVLDFGSRSEVSEKVRGIVTEYSFARYIFADTEGWFWNKSQALNWAVSQTKGEYLIVSDADLVYQLSFLAEVKSRISENKGLIYRFYYLPQGFRFKEDFTQAFFNFHNTANQSADSANGNIIITKQKIIAVGGYDTFFRWWGGEDRDMVNRLEKEGVTFQYFDSPTAPVFHQWHPKTTDDMPKGWLEVIEQSVKQTNKSLSLEKFIPPQDRPAKIIASQVKEKMMLPNFQFQFPKEKSWIDFIVFFQNLPKGQNIRIQQNFDWIQPKSSAGKFLQGVNRFFARVGFSYRWTEIRVIDTEHISWREVRDFLFYFVLEFEQDFSDYYLETEGEELLFVVVK
jgi:glycosyltransferase involved in cell wall biosynthesis